MQKITVLGDGGWGTTLAIYLSRQGYNVKLWGAFPKYISHLRKTRENTKFLKGIRIPKKVKILANLQLAIEDADLIILAVPSQFVSSILIKLKRYDLSHKAFLSVVKGIENKALRRISEMIYEVLGNVKLAILSGPNIAREIALGIPSATVIASKDAKLAKQLQKIFNSPSFRIYTNSDIVGVEFGGSMKNIIAIACGLCDGLGLGANTKAAIVTRGLAEMARLGKAMGARLKTFSGLSGLGDITATCMSPQSRNRLVGEQLGLGMSIKEIKKSMVTIAEGISTVKAIYRLSQKYKISAPITAEVYNIIYRNKKPIRAVVDLMTRGLKSE